MDVYRYETWSGFRAVITAYAELPREQRARYIFRGHSDSNWPLLSTLDRIKPTFTDDKERERFSEKLLFEFRREALGLSLTLSSDFPMGDALDLLARHHGLPSTLMDWTESPYIASYFAFERTEQSTVPYVAVWVVDRAKLGSVPDDAIDIIEDRDLLRFNVRALEQRGLFLRIKSGKNPLATLLGDAVFKFEIKASQRTIALAELDIMTITAKNLFRDLDGAARTAVQRVLTGV